MSGTVRIENNEQLLRLDQPLVRTAPSWLPFTWCKCGLHNFNMWWFTAQPILTHIKYDVVLSWSQPLLGPRNDPSKKHPWWFGARWFGDVGWFRLKVYKNQGCQKQTQTTKPEKSGGSTLRRLNPLSKGRPRPIFFKAPCPCCQPLPPRFPLHPIRAFASCALASAGARPASGDGSASAPRGREKTARACTGPENSSLDAVKTRH